MTAPVALTGAQWAEVKQLHSEALERPAPQRAAFVTACTSDEGVRQEVLSLLAFDVDGEPGDAPRTGFLSEPAAVHVLGLNDRTGERLGAWQVVAPLGSGGMGDVYEARRADGSYEDRAAIKALKRGLDSAAVLQRFARERQALARLKHPHIAMLLDAGLTADHLPYFVMEFVAGRPIDEAAQGLPLAARLGLFLQLADAVAYAHRHLLVHRDIKPGNVWVTAEGQVKLLDFGIAKALDPLDNAEALRSDATLGAALPYTPRYASPEQVRGDAVGTATDIYSLGVLLYLLLTGALPTGADATTPTEAAQAVLNDTPVAPSQVRTPGGDDPSWSARQRQLRGDLDNIVLKALEKPVERRYSTVEGLAQDVRRYLAGQPVSARPTRWTYVAGKFVRRHRVAVALGCAGMLALAGTTATALWQAQVARSERAAARQSLADVRELAQRMFGEVYDAMAGGVAPGQAAIVKVSSEYLSKRADAPDLELDEALDLAAALARMGNIRGNVSMSNLGQSDEAARHYAQALQVLERMRAEGNGHIRWWQQIAYTRYVFASQQRAMGQREAADAQLAVALQAIDRATALDPAKVSARRLRCVLLVAQADGQYDTEGRPSAGHLTEATATLRAAETCVAQLPSSPADDPVNARVMSTVHMRLARALMQAGHADQALPVTQRSLDRIEAFMQRDPGTRAFDRFADILRTVQAMAWLRSGHRADAVALLETSLHTARERLASESKDARRLNEFAAMAQTLGEVWLDQGRAAPALALCREALGLLASPAKAVTADPASRGQSEALRLCTARASLQLGKATEALAQATGLQAELAAYAEAVRAADPLGVTASLAQATALRAEALQALGRQPEALLAARDAVRQSAQHLDGDRVNLDSQVDDAALRARLAVALVGPGQAVPDACTWAREATQRVHELSGLSLLGQRHEALWAAARALGPRCGGL